MTYKEPYESRVIGYVACRSNVQTVTGLIKIAQTLQFDMGSRRSPCAVRLNLHGRALHAHSPTDSGLGLRCTRSAVRSAPLERLRSFDPSAARFAESVGSAGT